MRLSVRPSAASLRLRPRAARARRWPARALLSPLLTLWLAQALAAQAAEPAEPPATAAATGAGAGLGEAAAPADPDAGGAAPAGAPAAAPRAEQLETIEVVSRRMNEARTGIETQLGASVYTIDAAAISAMPGGDNSLLNQAILQAPDVAQDSFGQFHIRGEHNGLQYRLNGIILPEGISVFGQSLDPRLISTMQIITGALPAEYGLRTAGIVDITTKSGALDPGGTVSLYGGSHGTVQPSVNYGGAAGRGQYFVSLDGLKSDLGVESPDGSTTPLHDVSRQYHAFGYLDRVLDGDNRLTLVLSASSGDFQIPDLRGQPVRGGLSVDGQTRFDSALLNESQREQTQFVVLGWQHSAGPLDLQTAATLRNSTLQFTPDRVGDLLFNGISQSAFKRNVAGDWQLDAAWHLNDVHTLRVGSFAQIDTSSSVTSSQVFDIDPGDHPPFTQVVAIGDSASKTEHIGSLYAQDEWTLRENLTLNYGLRFDSYSAYSQATQLSPRLNLVWKPLRETTVHAGYSRYLTPPPFELVGHETISKFQGTTEAPPVARADTPLPERANYSDVGVLQSLNQQWSAGLDSYYKVSSNLIDEGQFGAPIILTPFNYQYGRQWGLEATLNYTGRTVTGYLNLARQSAMGRNIDSSQFNFTPDDLAYIATHYIDLDHEQKFTASGGLAARLGDTRLSGDFLVGSGLRADLPVPGANSIPNGMHLPYYAQLNAGISHELHFAPKDTLTLRLDVINVLDRVYEIRNGTGVGVGAPQYGPRRGVFVGLAKTV
jgi:outer membrane receptor protein involved in Fe transport